MSSLSTYLSTYLPTYLPVFIYLFYLSTHLSYLSTHLIYLSLSVYLSYLSIYIVYLPIYLLIVVVQSLTRVWLFVTSWTATHQASLSFTICWSLLKLMSIESMMPFKHLILCCPLPLLPSVFPSIRVFSNELALCIRWPKNWSFSFSISPSSEYSEWSPLGVTGLISWQSKELFTYSTKNLEFPCDILLKIHKTYSFLKSSHLFVTWSSSS